MLESENHRLHVKTDDVSSHPPAAPQRSKAFVEWRAAFCPNVSCTVIFHRIYCFFMLPVSPQFHRFFFFFIANKILKLHFWISHVSHLYIQSVSKTWARLVLWALLRWQLRMSRPRCVPVLQWDDRQRGGI